MNTLLKLSLVAIVGVLVSTFIVAQSSEQTNATWTPAGTATTQVTSTSSAKASISLCKTSVPKVGYKIKARAVITNLYGAAGPVKAMTANAAAGSYGNVITSNVGQTSTTGVSPSGLSASSVVSGGLKSDVASWVSYGTTMPVSSVAFCS